MDRFIARAGDVGLPFRFIGPPPPVEFSRAPPGLSLRRMPTLWWTLTRTQKSQLRRRWPPNPAW